MIDDIEPLLTTSRPSSTKLNAAPHVEANFYRGVSHDIVFVGKCCIGQAFVAFIACIVISIQKDWIHSTETHCHVPNYLPSISSAIGGYAPQKYIWRIAIAIQISPRLLFAVVYLNHNLAQEYRTLDHVAYPLLCRLTFVVVVVENLALVLLSYVASVEWYAVHKLGFVSFVVCSVLHQLLSLLVCRLSTTKMSDPCLRRLVHRKSLIIAWHLLSLASAMYFFWRHNEYCEPGVYTLFALFEYFVVISNMAFHYTFAWDFAGSTLDVMHVPPGQQLKYSIA